MTMSILFHCYCYCTVNFPAAEIDLDDSLIVAGAAAAVADDVDGDDDDDAAALAGHEYNLNGVDVVRSTLDFSDQ